jgi:hypothetical protein
MSAQLTERLRGANPVRVDETVVADEVLLARILATPRAGEEPRSCASMDVELSCSSLEP